MYVFLEVVEVHAAAIAKIEVLYFDDHEKEALARVRELLQDEALTEYHRVETLFWIGV